MAIMTAIAVGSALVSAYGQYTSAKAQANAKREQSQLNFLKADEILNRNIINNDLLMRSALIQQGTQVAQFAGSGRTGETATSRALVRDTVERASDQIYRNTQAAEWEADMVRIGAESSLGAADQIETAGVITAIGTAGFGTANAYANSPKGDKISKPTKYASVGSVVE